MSRFHWRECSIPEIELLHFPVRFGAGNDGVS